MKRYQKILIGILITIVLLFGGIQLYFSFSLDEQLKQTLVTRFTEATNEEYQLDIGDFDLQILGRRLQLSNVVLTPKLEKGPTTVSASLEELKVSGIGLLKLMFQRQLTLHEIILLNPTINLTAIGDTSHPTDQSSSYADISRRFSDISLQLLENVSIPSLKIDGLSLNYKRAEQPDTSFSLSNSFLHLRDIRIDSSFMANDHWIPGKQISSTFRDVRYQTSGGLYDISADLIDFSSINNTLEISQIKLRPRYSKKYFADRIRHEVDQISLEIDRVRGENIDSQKLNRKEGFFGGAIRIEKPHIEIYRDKRQPFPPDNRPKMPQQMIRGIPFPIDIDSISVSRGNIRYIERLPKTSEAGSVTFTNLQATFTNLSNIENRWSKDRPPTLQVATKVMDEAALQSTFTFPMHSNVQHVEGSLKSMPIKPLNEALVPLGFVRIDDGKIHSMEFEMDLTKHRSTGSVILIYKDLKISVLDRENSKETLGNKVTSLLANTFKIKSHNSPEDPRIGKINYERDDNKSTFNYWWKSLLSGLKSSIGA